jgi:hypothetical protein
LIKKLKDKKSPGPDKFLSKVLKEVCFSVVDNITYIFNLSIEYGSVPIDWKLANITPIYKKGCKEDPANYRPISLTSIIGKLLETIITNYIVDFLETNELIVNSQHGFRRNRSCVTNLLDFFNYMFEKYDENKSIDIIYLDFKKAFDKVPHQRLLLKLYAIGIRGKVYNWILNWLTNRQQRVVLHGICSDWNNVTSGVPQGSVLGPILFIIYVNDLEVDLISKIVKLADDTKLGLDVNHIEGINAIQHDLNLLEDWSRKWQMDFNLEKCKVMHIGFKNPQASYTFMGAQLNSTDLEKDLGIYISSNLKVNKQCVEAEKKAMKILRYIKRQFTYRTEEIVIPLFILHWLDQFWNMTSRYGHLTYTKILLG